jgi:hypothetical protein
MAARIDDVLAIDDVDHLKTRTVARQGVHIAGIANRHFKLLMECQFADDEQLELLPHAGHTRFCFCLLTKRLASASKVSKARASARTSSRRCGRKLCRVRKVAV